MYSDIAQYESAIRLAIFIGSFSLLLFLEWLFPWRVSISDNAKRIITNLSLMLINTFTMRLLFPALSVSVALWTSSQNIGLSHFLGGPALFTLFYCFIALDFIIYLQHRLFHKIPLLWRFHRIHHLDKHLDASSGVRFHPLEAIVSLFIKVLAIILLGAPVICVIAFEVALNSLSLFNHANIKLPRYFERILRKLIVTPKMHRIHHSTVTCEHSSNFGFNFSFWDKFFNTYLERAGGGDTQLCIGLTSKTELQKNTSLLQLLSLPFRR